MLVKTAVQGTEELDPAAYRTLKQRDACVGETSPLIHRRHLRSWNWGNGQLQKIPHGRLTIEQKVYSCHSTSCSSCS